VVFQGAVDEIAPEADRQKGTVLVKVRIIDPRDLVRPEVNAQVTFFAKKDPAAGAKAQRPRVWVPRPALQKDEAGKTVVYVVNGGRAVAREVRVGEESERGVEVLQGLEGSEQVIVSPLEKVNAGRRVEVGGQ
jgi:multidrug efflux pump subunit AcrA (membrane-fusion protein)